ncbi:hypothetical protein GE09DRAFT_1231389 [Coniochaeta sp. 2T2.1]|nr:hypothetical protein GE09DRAFT_1231389 [Coniochaeta sp. 2T2.1]
MASTELLKQCPEYNLRPEPTGPTLPILPPIDGLELPDLEEKIFIIDKNRLDAVRQQLANSTPCRGSQPTVSRYMALAALTWAHTTRARLCTSSLSPSLLDHHQPTLFNAYDWLSPTKNLFPSNHSLKHHFGNSITWAVTRLPSLQPLVSSCLPPSLASSSLTPHANLATTISASNASISPHHIHTRTALFSTTPDIRRLGLTLDARLPHDFSFNTWLHLGGRATFWFPAFQNGEERQRQRKPDAVRRVQGNCGLPSALILPAVGGEEEGEIWLLVTLEREAMKRLEGDGGWIGICRVVVG